MTSYLLDSINKAFNTLKSFNKEQLSLATDKLKALINESIKKKKSNLDTQNIKAIYESNLKGKYNKLIKDSFEHFNDKIIINNVDFTDKKNAGIFKEFDDFSNVVFNNCTFPKLNNKNFSKAIFNECKFNSDIINCNLEFAHFEDIVSNELDLSHSNLTLKFSYIIKNNILEQLKLFYSNKYFNDYLNRLFLKITDESSVDFSNKLFGLKFNHQSNYVTKETNNVLENLKLLPLLSQLKPVQDIDNKVIQSFNTITQLIKFLNTHNNFENFQQSVKSNSEIQKLLLTPELKEFVDEYQINNLEKLFIDKKLSTQILEMLPIYYFLLKHNSKLASLLIKSKLGTQQKNVTEISKLNLLYNQKDLIEDIKNSYLFSEAIKTIYLIPLYNNLITDLINFRKKYIKSSIRIKSLPEMAFVSSKPDNIEPDNCYYAKAEDILNYKNYISSLNLKPINNNVNIIKFKINKISKLCFILTQLYYLKDNQKKINFKEYIGKININEFKDLQLPENINNIIKNLENNSFSEAIGLITENDIFNLTQIETSLKDEYKNNIINKNVKSFKDFLIESGKISNEKPVVIKSMNMTGNYNFFNFSDCIFIRNKFSNEFNYVDFSNCSFINNLISGDFKYCNFSNAFIQEINKTIYNIKYSGQKLNFSNSIFDQSNIVFCDFSKANFSNTIFNSAMIQKVKFDEANLNDSDFSFATIYNSKFNKISARNLDLSKSSFCFSELNNSEIIDSSFKQSFIKKSAMRRSKLIRCNFEKSWLDVISSSFSLFNNTIFNDAEKLILHGRKKRLELCNIRNAKLIELGKDFSTLNLIYDKNDLKRMTDSTKAEFRKALENEVNKKFFGSLYDIINPILSNKLLNFARLNLPNIKESAIKSIGLFALTEIGFFVLSPITSSFQITWPITLIKFAVRIFVFYYIADKIYSIYTNNAKENDNNINEFDTTFEKVSKTNLEFEKNLNDLRNDVEGKFRATVDKANNLLEIKLG